MHSKIKDKIYHVKIKEDYDVKDGYFYYVELNTEILKELGWREGDKVDASVKMGNKGNVIVVNRA